MSSFADLVRFVPTLGGTTDWVYSSAVGGCQSPAAANVLNGVSYKVYAVSADLTQWEISTGIYSSGVLTFPRTTVLYNSSGTGTAAGQSGAGTKISFSTVPQVSIVALAEDLASVRSVKTTLFVASGTYTPSAGMLYADIEVRASGGGGGAVNQSTAGGAAGGGGGQGSRSLSTFSAATLGASQAITIGSAGLGGAAGSHNGAAGGDCSFGSLVIAKGGGGGGFSDPASVNGGPGTGGVPGTGTFTEAGMPGGGGTTASVATMPLLGGFGGGPGGGPESVGAGSNATNYGAGGSGAARTAAGSTGTAAGGNGSAGYVLIKEYLSQ